MRTFPLTTWAITTLFYVAAWCIAADREPAPASTAIEAGTARVRELFKADYAKRLPADMKHLADKLIKETNDSSNDSATRYALGAEAIDLYCKSGDARNAVAATDLLASRFVVDAVSLREQTFVSLSRNLRGEPTRLAGFMDEVLPVIETHLRDGNFDRASTLMRMASQQMQGASDQPAMRVASDRLATAYRQLAEYQKIKPMIEKLETDPKHPSASTVVGKYYCITRGDWIQGLPLLAAGDDAPLRDAATADIEAGRAEPVDEGAGRREQIARFQRIGDAWMKVAGQQPTLAKVAFAERALLWYSKADGNVSGLDQVELTRKIEDARKLSLGSGVPTFFAKLARDQQSRVRKFRNKYYLIVDTPLNIPDAEAWARNVGATLVAIADENENEFVRSLAQEKARPVWIGFTDAEKEGVWVWCDGSRSTYTNWEPHQPDNHRGREDHAEMHFRNGRWNDVNGLSEKRIFIVQWRMN